MHLVKTVVSLFALSSFAAAQLGGDFDSEYGLARREVEIARDGYLAARDEFLVARNEYIEKRGVLKKKGKCYKDGIQNLCGTPVKGGGMSPCGICPRGFEGKSCPCPVRSDAGQQAILDLGNATYFTRVPSQEIEYVAAGPNDEGTTYHRDSEGTWVIVYTPTGALFQSSPKILKISKPQTSWYDPICGVYVVFEFSKAGEDSTVVKFSPPNQHKSRILALISRKRE